MKPTDLIEFLIEEAHHCVINMERFKNYDHALAANTKNSKGKSKTRKGDDKPTGDSSKIICHNCKKPGHKIADCWSKGGRKEGQHLRQRKAAKTEMAVMAVAGENKDKMFAFNYMSDFVNIA